jgi:PAS domain S-box-containing protein
MLKKYFFVIIVLSIGCLFSILGFLTVQKIKQQQIAYEFEKAAQERIWTIKQSIQNALEVLHATASFYKATENKINRQEFNIFATSFFNPHLIALNWVPRIVDSQRKFFEMTTQINRPKFQIKERNLQGKMLLAQQREEYFPIYYRVSYIPTKQLLGFDLASDTNLKATLNLARDTGTMQATAWINQAQDKKAQFSILVFYPVYQKQSVFNTPQLQENLKGFIVGRLNLKSIIDSILKYLPLKKIDIYLEDESANTIEHLLYISQPAVGKLNLVQSSKIKKEESLQIKKTFNVAGRTWSILCVPTSTYLVTDYTWISFATLLGGLLFTLGIIFYIERSREYESINQQEIIERQQIEAALRQAQKHLKEYSHTLEVQVIKRTNQLAQQNILLQEEIEERKKIEAELLNSQERIRQFFELPLIGMAITLPSANWLHFNDKLCELLGYSREELFNQNWQALTHPDDLAENIKLFEQLLTGKISEYTLDKRFIRKDGQIIYASNSVRCVFSQGKIAYLVELIQNITERKQYNQKLEQEVRERTQTLLQRENHLQAIFYNVAVGIILVNPNGNFTQYNNKWLEMIGYSAKEITLLTYLDITHPDDIEISVKNFKLLTENKTDKYHIEKRFIRKNSSLFWADVSVTMISKKGKLESVVGVIVDITERKQTEEKLQEVAKAAESANRAKSAFLANMSHELRTPLNGILGYTQILSRDKKLCENLQEGIGIIERSANYLLTLINDILDLSKIEAGKLEISPKDFNLTLFIQGVTEIFIIRARQKGINFICQTLSPLPVVIHGDDTRLRQIIINLLSNAVKFTNKGSVTLKVSMQKNGKLCFQVEDTGIGIASEDIKHIFDPFQQVGNKIYQAEGTGLGLAITKKLVKMMGGELHVKSLVGQGTTFWTALDLPKVKETIQIETESTTIIGYKIKDKKLDFPPIKILIIDDTLENRLILQKFLTPLGFEIIEAENAQEGFKKVYEFQPNLIILDLMMPIMNGFEFCRQLRKIVDFKKIVVIASSASVFEHHRQDSLKAGCNDFIPKPIKFDQLLANLQQYLPIEWIYETPIKLEITDFAYNTENNDFYAINLPAEQAAVFYDLAMMGDINGILQQVQGLKQIDEQLVPLANHIAKLANNYKDDVICELVKPHIKK